MPYCPRCGEKLPEDAYYCTKCGYRLKPPRFEVGGGLQRYWFKRALAYLVDAVIVSIATLLLGFFLSIPFTLSAIIRGGWRGWGFTFPLSTGFVQLVYFTIMEWGLGSTVGKQLMDLKVEGAHSLFRAFMRNLTKLHMGLLILDVVAGFLLGDPRRKFTDAISGTWVVEHRAPRGLDPYRDGGGGDHLEDIGLGILIITMGILLMARPHLPLTVADWLMRCEGRLVLPPREVLESLLWLLLALGLWLLASASIRLLKGLNVGRAMDELLLAAVILLSALLLREQLIGLLPLHHLPPLLLILMGAAVTAISLLKTLGVSRS
ncbi:RDD family protein [Candidatus Bathyarchaeota archaeon]|nr:RDD family protein [Candidatus Bathyarchaeota archaeon]